MIELDRRSATVRRLRVRVREDRIRVGAPVLRLRAERLLNQVDWTLPGMPPGAVLLVRHMSIRAALTRETGERNWEQAVRDRIQALFRSGACRVWNPNAPPPDAVLFADSAELLVCLTSDWLAGRVEDRWYWRQYLGVPHVTPGVMARVYARSAPSLPAALAALRVEQARAAAALFSTEETRAVVSALQAAFEMPAEPLTWSDEETRTGSEGLIEAPASDADGALNAPGSNRNAPPWIPWLPEGEGATLAPSARYLLGVALALYHAPSFARSPHFAGQAAVWWDAAQRTRDTPGITRPTRTAPRSAGHLPSHREPTAGSENPLGPMAMLEKARTPKRPSDREEETPPQPSSSAVELDHRDAMVEPQPAARAATTVKTNRDWDVLLGAREPRPEGGVPTELGGILYLINLLVWLELPGIWAEGALAEHLSGWAIVEALARTWLGDKAAAYADDPVWTALRLLDERGPDELIGPTLPLLTSFLLPARWLRRYAPRDPVWVAASEGSRVRLFAEAGGCLIAELPCTAETPEQVVETTVESYRALGIRAAWHWGAGAIPPLAPCAARAVSATAREWLERVSGFLSALLVRALSEPEMDRGSLDALLWKSGRLLITRTHIDLYLAMEQIRMPIRRAGLDRDPGWVSDLGRIVQFHFE